MRLAAVLFAFAVPAAAQNVVDSFYPLHLGNIWVYAKESLDGAMDRPEVERWTTEETVASAIRDADLDATLVTLRVRVLDHRLPPGGLNDSTRRERSESHILVRSDCMWVVDGAEAAAAYVDDPLHSARFRDDFLRGQVPPDYCFPMKAGKEWGRVANTSPAQEYIWRVDRMSGDPYGPPGERTFHFSTHLGGGDFADRWFTEGIGPVQENTEHHGTYDEDRVRLLRSVINGRSRTYDLPPAKTVPLGEYDCEGSAWQHFVHGDGTPFRNRADCVASRRRR
jgi:hypothetical protein